MTVAVIARDGEQKMRALEQANVMRFAIVRERAEIKQLPLSAGCEHVADLLDRGGSGLENTTVYRLLSAIRGAGQTRVRRLLRDAGVVSGDRRVRELTTRQRAVLADELRGEANVARVNRERRRGL